MFDIGVTKLAIISGLARGVIGPERLPGLARTLGTLLGRARRYVADVKEEVNRSMDLEALRKMREDVEGAAREVGQTLQTHANAIDGVLQDGFDSQQQALPDATFPVYRHPKKNWRLRQGATPRWYKVRQGVRMHALSGAARVARFRPPQH